MLTLPGHPLPDKIALIGGCARLPLRCYADRLRAAERVDFSGERGCVEL